MKLLNKNPASKEQTAEAVNYLKGAGIESGELLSTYAPSLTAAQIKKLGQNEFDARGFKDMHDKAHELAMKLTESDNHQDLMVSANLQYVLTSAYFNVNMIYGSIEELLEKSDKSKETKSTSGSGSAQDDEEVKPCSTSKERIETAISRSIEVIGLLSERKRLLV